MVQATVRQRASDPGRLWRRGKWALVVLWLVAVAVAGSSAGKLQSVQSDQAVNYLPKAAQSTQVEQLLARFPTGKTIAAVVVYARPGA